MPSSRRFPPSWSVDTHDRTGNNLVAKVFFQTAKPPAMHISGGFALSPVGAALTHGIVGVSNR